MNLLGAHLSTAGGLVNALDEAARLKMTCVQVFTKNQRQWKATPLKDADVAAWLSRLRALGWHRRRGPNHVVSHNSYLINLASPDRAAWERSIQTQRIELERCETLMIPLLVSHPGAHLGKARPPGEPHDLTAPPTPDEAAGMKRIARALDRLHRDLPGYRTITCLETTVGSGSNLGYAFEQLARIRDLVRAPERVGFCFDTCHVTAAGYDMSTDVGAGRVLRHFGSVCGMDTLRAFHMNDSEGAIGSRRDRHAHIGKGRCGTSCFRTIMNRRRFDRVPKLLETPKGANGSGTPWDVANIRRLKGLIRRPAASR